MSSDSTSALKIPVAPLLTSLHRSARGSTKAVARDFKLRRFSDSSLTVRATIPTAQREGLHSEDWAQLTGSDQLGKNSSFLDLT